MPLPQIGPIQAISPLLPYIPLGGEPAADWSRAKRFGSDLLSRARQRAADVANEKWRMSRPVPASALHPYDQPFADERFPMLPGGRDLTQQVNPFAGMLRQGFRGADRKDPLTIEELPVSRDMAIAAMGDKRVLPSLPDDMDGMKRRHQEQLYRSYGYKEMPGGGWVLPEHLNPPGQTTTRSGLKPFFHGRDVRRRGLQDIRAGRTPLAQRTAPGTRHMPFHRMGSRRGQGESFFGVGAQMEANRQRRQDEFWQKREEGQQQALRRQSQEAKDRRKMMDQMTDEEIRINVGGRRAFAEEIIDPDTGAIIEPETMYNPDSWRWIIVGNRRRWVRTRAGGQVAKKISPAPEPRPPARQAGPRMTVSGAVAAIPAENDRRRMNEMITNPQGSFSSEDEETRTESLAEIRRIVGTITNNDLKSYMTNLVNEHIARSSD